MHKDTTTVENSHDNSSSKIITTTTTTTTTITSTTVDLNSNTNSNNSSLFDLELDENKVVEPLFPKNDDEGNDVSHDKSIEEFKIKKSKYLEKNRKFVESSSSSTENSPETKTPKSNNEKEIDSDCEIISWAENSPLKKDSKKKAGYFEPKLEPCSPANRSKQNKSLSRNNSMSSHRNS